MGENNWFLQNSLKTNMKLHFRLIGFILVVLYSCTKINQEELAFDAERQKLCELDTVHFTEHVLPIINVKCMPCHDNTQASGGLTLVTYDDISFLALDGILLKSIKHESGASPMPEGDEKLHQCYIYAIETWVAQGALNN
jgi:hypothetical protein